MTRSLRIEKVPAAALYCIKWNGGGEVPAVLSGHYTSPLAAQQAIDAWAASAEREVEVESPPADEAKKRGRPPIKSIGE